MDATEGDPMPHGWFGHDYTTLTVRKQTRGRINSVLNGIHNVADYEGRRTSVNTLLLYCLEHLLEKEEFIHAFTRWVADRKNVQS